MSTITNAPESLNFSPHDNQIFEAGRAACASLAKTFELWITVARAVELARTKADKIGTRSAFERILNQQGLAASLGSNWDSQKSTASKLLKILERLPEVEAWRAGLTAAQRINWSAPTTVYRHCPVFANETAENRERKEKELEARTSACFGDEDEPDGDDAAENSALIVIKLQNRIRELEAEIATLKAENEKLKAENAKLKRESEPAVDSARKTYPLHVDLEWFTADSSIRGHSLHFDNEAGQEHSRYVITPEAGKGGKKFSHYTVKCDGKFVVEAVKIDKAKALAQDHADGLRSAVT